MAVVLVATFAILAVFTPGPKPAAADGIMFIPAGAFWMGADDGAPDEAPRHRVHVPDVWIERDKVTNAEFADFLNAHGSRCRHSSSINEAQPDRRAPEPCEGAPTAIQKMVDPAYARHPVAVSWYGARDYCAWRGRRLPTEAEWEKAARGLYGVQDLLGNLGEWTSTILKPYPYRHDDGREPFTGAGRVVVRGASHDDPVESLSVTRRRSYDRRGAAAGHHVIGFRCATSDDLGEVAPGGGR